MRDYVRVSEPEVSANAAPVSIQVSLSAGQRARLRALARQIPAPADGSDPVDALLAGLASASVAEYVAHASLQPPITTVGALRELRLAVLSEHLLGGELPGEGFVADLFALTGPEARSLLRRSVARQPERLQQAIRTSALRSVQAAKPADAKKTSYVLTADPAVVSLLYELLENSGTNPPPLQSRADAIGKYNLLAATRDVLLEQLDGVPPDQPKPAARRRPARARGRRAQE